MRQFGVTSLVISHDIASCFRSRAIPVIQGASKQLVPDALNGPSEVARNHRNSAVDTENLDRDGPQSEPRRRENEPPAMKEPADVRVARP